MGISLESIILILILALVLFGPEKLPQFAEKLGRWLAKIRQAGHDLSHQYHQAVNPLLAQQSPAPGGPPAVTCPKCALKFEKHFHFCPHCGHFLEDFQPPAIPQAGAAAVAVTHCPQCARNVEADFLFCPGCGQNLLAARHYPEPPPPPLPKTIICPHCSRRLDTDFLFCPECGQTLEQRPAAPPAGAG